MANTVVTSSTKWVKAVFNDDAPAVGMDQAYFSKEHIAEVRCLTSVFVSVKLDSGEVFACSTDGSINTLTIDSVDGVAPTSNADLCDKLAALIDY